MNGSPSLASTSSTVSTPSMPPTKVLRSFLVLLFLPALALARQPDGALGLIQAPHNGKPAILLPGQSFDAILTEKASLTLIADDGAKIPLEATWHEIPGIATGHCTIPPGTPPRTYAIEALAGDKTDRNMRAVYVINSFPEMYAVGHVTDTHIGVQGVLPPVSDTLRSIIAAINEASPAFVLITGDLTEANLPGEFKEFLDIMDTCNAPTFTCAGNHDRPNYERFMGTSTYMFRYGVDGYLAFDTKDMNVADDLGPQDGFLEIYARELKKSRWSIGFTHRYEFDMGMRAQLILFVDNPIDHLIFGHFHTGIEGLTKVPWGTTPLTITNAARDGFYRFYDVSDKGFRRRELQRVPGF